ncbi:MAG: hypothetical protein LBI48_11545 [Burkholderiaceae bacterium]|jgi:hypothetical protein|nr:hypothetical protein [Burkholderiaceae bacterium]
MIYIVEIPHQRPASCWVCADKADFIRRASAAYIRHGDTPDTGGSEQEQFDAWRDYIASDLSGFFVYENEDGAVAGLATDFSRHGGARAAGELYKELVKYGALNDEPEIDNDE